MAAGEKNLNDPSIEVNKAIEEDNLAVMVKADGSINKIPKEFLTLFLYLHYMGFLNLHRVM